MTLALGIGLLLSRGEDFVRWYVENLRTTIEARLPESLPEEDRARLDRGFDGLADTLMSDTLSVSESWRIQRVILETVQVAQERTLTLEEVRALASALEDASSGSERPEPNRPTPQRDIAAGPQEGGCYGGSTEDRSFDVIRASWRAA